MRGVSAIAVASALGFGLLGAAADADAHDVRACGACAAAGTTRIVRTIHPLYTVTRYHDLSVYHHVTRLHYVVDVTRIQPIVHVQDVTRVHHITVVRDAYAYPPRDQVPVAYGPPQLSPSARYDYGYGCYCGVDQ